MIDETNQPPKVDETGPQGVGDLNALREQLRGEDGLPGNIAHDQGPGEPGSPGSGPGPVGHPGLDGAIGFNEQRQTDLTVQDNNTEHPRGNVELAEAMADSMRPIEQMINNINDSDMRDKETRVALLRDRGEHLAALAEERYIMEKRSYDEVRDKAVGDLIFAATSITEPADTEFYHSILKLYPTAEGKYSQSHDHDLNSLTGVQAMNLTSEIFTVAGVDTVSSINPHLNWKSLDIDDEGWRNQVYDTNLGNGLKILEQRYFDEAASKFTQVRYAAVSEGYANNLVYPQNA